MPREIFKFLMIKLHKKEVDYSTAIFRGINSKKVGGNSKCDISFFFYGNSYFLVHPMTYEPIVFSSVYYYATIHIVHHFMQWAFIPKSYINREQ